MLYFCHVKILKRIISIAIWTVIALNLLTAAVLRLPGVQQSVGSKVSAVLSEALGTTVSIGRVDLGFLDRIIIDDVTILDQQRQPMLIITRLSAKVDYLPLTQGRISISSAQLFGAHARLVCHRFPGTKGHAKPHPTRFTYQRTDHPALQRHLRPQGCGKNRRTV